MRDLHAIIKREEENVKNGRGIRARNALVVSALCASLALAGCKQEKKHSKGGDFPKLPQISQEKPTKEEDFPELPQISEKRLTKENIEEIRELNSERFERLVQAIMVANENYTDEQVFKYNERTWDKQSMLVALEDPETRMQKIRVTGSHDTNGVELTYIKGNDFDGTGKIVVDRILIMAKEPRFGGFKKSGPTAVLDDGTEIIRLESDTKPDVLKATAVTREWRPTGVFPPGEVEMTFKEYLEETGLSYKRTLKLTTAAEKLWGSYVEMAKIIGSRVVEGVEITPFIRIGPDGSKEAMIDIGWSTSPSTQILRISQNGDIIEIDRCNIHNSDKRSEILLYNLIGEIFKGTDVKAEDIVFRATSREKTFEREDGLQVSYMRKRHDYTLHLYDSDYRIRINTSKMPDTAVIPRYTIPTSDAELADFIAFQKTIAEELNRNFEKAMKNSNRFFDTPNSLAEAVSETIKEWADIRTRGREKDRLGKWNWGNNLFMHISLWPVDVLREKGNEVITIDMICVDRAIIDYYPMNDNKEKEGYKCLQEILEKAQTVQYGKFVIDKQTEKDGVVTYELTLGDMEEVLYYY